MTSAPMSWPMKASFERCLTYAFLLAFVNVPEFAKRLAHLGER